MRFGKVHPQYGGRSCSASSSFKASTCGQPGCRVFPSSLAAPRRLRQADTWYVMQTASVFWSGVRAHWSFFRTSMTTLPAIGGGQPAVRLFLILMERGAARPRRSEPDSSTCCEVIDSPNCAAKRALVKDPSLDLPRASSLTHVAASPGGKTT